MTPRTAYTIGYQGTPRDDFIATLVASGVDFVVDTRMTPTSRRVDYRKNVLATALAEADIAYVSVPTLGVPKEDRALASADWNRFASKYVGRLADSDLVEVLGLAGSRTVALLCFEAEEGQCHRLPLSRVLEGRSMLRFEHLHPGRVD